MKTTEVTALIRDKGIVAIDYKFMDLPGTWQHFSTPVSEWSDEVYENGVGFDGSSIRGFRAINESDMLLIPDPATAFVDPFARRPTLSFVCNVKDPITKEAYARDPRYIAQKAEAFLKSTGIGDTAYFGPEAEFFIFDDVRFDNAVNKAFYQVDSMEGRWNTGREENPNLGYKPRYKEGYFPVPPTDKIDHLRDEMVEVLEACGVRVEAQHHEVASGGQAEIDVRFDSLLKMADTLALFKYIVKNVARRNNKVATFMPKPLFGDNGSGMHVHVSIWKGGKNLFAGDASAGLAQPALYFIGGLLKHARALVAITSPTTNSYKRLVPGYEAPVNLAYSQRNRSAAVRIPMYHVSPKAKRIEFRCPDPATNGYLCFAAMLLAGIDGIKNRIDPGAPLDRNIYDLSPEERKGVPSTPGSLEEALDALEKDHDFLLQGDVFTADVLETWIKYKRENEADSVRLRPHPQEYALYFDI